ncbi:MAG: alpha/beta fold hydrolase [Candidatus Lokiarchaeota archaeon]|nr:alpha/beta fold hydrolase [Candidatus Lokiarchaeota archaeon]
MAVKKYQLVLTLVFLGMTLVGAIGLNTYPGDVVRSTRVATTSDGVQISFNTYHKSTIPANRPVIVMGHGVIVNKEMMTNFAIELAARDFVVASIDWRGHGHSGGTLENNKHILDLEAVIGTIPAIVPTANMSAIGLIGYSMGGGPTFQYAVNHSAVKAWVGVGTAPRGNVANTTNPRNVLVIRGEFDEAFSLKGLVQQMVNLTGVSSPADVQLDHLYGSIASGNARKLDTVPLADHLTVPWDAAFISSATDWMVQTFDAIVPDLSVMVYHARAFMLFAGLIGLVGLVYGIALMLARALGFKDKEPGQEIVGSVATAGTSESSKANRTRNDAGLSSPRFLLLYYAWTFLLIPTAIIPAMSFFLPLFLTSFLVTLVGCYAINVAIFSWRYFKRSMQGTMPFTSIFWSGARDRRTWLIGTVVTLVIVLGFWLVVGLNYLGSMPALDRTGYVLIYGAIMFLCYMAISTFSEKVVVQFIDRKVRFSSEKVRYVVHSFVAFMLVYSWFFAIIMLICAAMGSMFIAMIAWLMIPIYLFGSFAGVYLQRLTGSSIPNALLQATLLTLLIVTLSPLGSLLRMFM